MNLPSTSLGSHHLPYSEIFQNALLPIKTCTNSFTWHQSNFPVFSMTEQIKASWSAFCSPCCLTCFLLLPSYFMPPSHTIAPYPTCTNYPSIKTQFKYHLFLENVHRDHFLSLISPHQPTHLELIIVHSNEGCLSWIWILSSPIKCKLVCWGSGHGCTYLPSHLTSPYTHKRCSVSLLPHCPRCWI